MWGFLEPFDFGMYLRRLFGREEILSGKAGLYCTWILPATLAEDDSG
jgi:hypothetical protein